MDNRPNIYQRINAVMSECDYLKKEKAQQGVGIKYDEVIAMIRDLLIKHGIVIVVRQTEMGEPILVEGTKQKVYQGRYEMDLVNMDNPAEVVTHSAFAQGMDGGDKAPGKAHTYAVKIMLVKGFGIETGIDDESRAEKIEKKNMISIDEHNILAQFCLSLDSQGRPLGWSQLGQEVGRAYNIERLDLLPQSKFKEVLELCKVRTNANN